MLSKGYKPRDEWAATKRIAGLPDLHVADDVVSPGWMRTPPAGPLTRRGAPFSRAIARLQRDLLCHSILGRPVANDEADAQRFGMAGKRGQGVHTAPKPGGSGWVNQVGGKVVSEHRKKETAVERGREIAKEKATEHTIHKKDGTIGGKNSYGNDPIPPKDKN